MVSPVAGIDKAALVDVTGLADRILARLEAQLPVPRPLPEILGPDRWRRKCCHAGPSQRHLAGRGRCNARFAFGFAGCPGDAGGTAGIIAADDAEAVLFALLDRFLDQNGKLNSAGTVISRFRHLLVDHAADGIAAGLPFRISRDTAWQRRQPVRFRSYRPAGAAAKGSRLAGRGAAFGTVERRDAAGACRPCR
jgi:hypothetical protein